MLYELMCMAVAIYFEARGEPLIGQIAVGQVIVNRVHAPEYPDDVCSVVYEAEYYPWQPDVPVRNRCQFSFFCDGKSDVPSNMAAFDLAVRVSDAVLGGRADDFVHGATHYHSVGSSPYWADSKQRVASVSRHVFYM